MPDFQQPVAEAEKEDTLENLTPFERQMMMKHRISWLFWEIAHASHSVSYTHLTLPTIYSV